VIGQVAVLSIIVLIKGWFVSKEFESCARHQSGFDAEHILTLSFNTAVQKYYATKAERF
jgi:hypothetical protein